MIRAKLTQEQFDGLAEKLQAAEGITLAGKSGTISKSGATAAWSYDGGTLTITVTHAPWGATGVAEHRISQALVANGVAVGT